VAPSFEPAPREGARLCIPRPPDSASIAQWVSTSGAWIRAGKRRAAPPRRLSLSAKAMRSASWRFASTDDNRGVTAWCDSCESVLGREHGHRASVASLMIIRWLRDPPANERRWSQSSAPRAGRKSDTLRVQGGSRRRVLCRLSNRVPDARAVRRRRFR
jgi:hypothetical protein